MSVPEMKEYSNASKEWRLNGILHRTDGPAIEYSTGTKEWWVNGKRHRTDGPAIEWSDGSKAWYLNGNVVTWFEVYCYNLRTGDIQTAERILAMPK